MSRAAEPAKLMLKRNDQQLKNKGFKIPHAGENRTQAPLTFTETRQTESVARGVGALQRSANEPKVLMIKCITYNVESLNIERLTQICSELGKSKYNLAMIQGTRWNLSGSIAMGGFQIYAAPAAKTSTEAHAGVCIIIDQKLTKKTK